MKKNVFVSGLAVAALLFTLTSCDEDDDVMEQQNARVLVVHASPNAPAVDLLVDDKKVNTSALAYPNNTGYLTVGAGNHNIKVNATGTNNSVINANVDLMKGAAYTVFAYDVVSAIKPLVVMDNLATPASGKAHIRFMHLSPNAPAVTVGVLAGSNFMPLFSNRSFETAATATANQAFISVDAGTFTVQVRAAGTNDAVLTVPNVTLQAGKIYTVFAQGLVGNSTSPLGASVIMHN